MRLKAQHTDNIKNCGFKTYEAKLIRATLVKFEHEIHIVCHMQNQNLVSKSKAII